MAKNYSLFVLVFLTAYIFNYSGDDAGNEWLVVSLVTVVLHFAVTAFVKVPANRKK